jgi:hypothetical protein
MTDTKKRVYLAVRKKTSDIEVDPFNGYLLDKQYLDKTTGLYLNNEDNNLSKDYL